MAHFPTLSYPFFLVVALLAYPTTSTKTLNYANIATSGSDNVSAFMNVQDRQCDSHKIPTSCNDLACNGWRENGLQLLKATDGIKVVFCDFLKPVNTAGYETVIGYTGVKSGPVFFHGQRNTEYILSIMDSESTINYDVEAANIGGGFDGSAGIFTAPKAGKYYFSFSAMAKKRFGMLDIIIYLRKNGETIAYTSCNANSAECPLNLQTTVFLKASDNISVVAYSLSSGILNELGNYHFTNFFGQLLEEDI